MKMCVKYVLLTRFYINLDKNGLEKLSLQIPDIQDSIKQIDVKSVWRESIAL